MLMMMVEVDEDEDDAGENREKKMHNIHFSMKPLNQEK